MSVPMDHSDPKPEEKSKANSNQNWTINVPDVRTVKVSNVSLAASNKDIQEFFSFSGDIQYVEMQRETEKSQIAYVTFKDSQGADTALLLTGATIADLSVTITLAEHYHLPPDAVIYNETTPNSTGSAVMKAEDVVSSMLARGFILGKDALNKAKAFDEKHQLTSNATATVASIDRKMGLTEKLSMGTAVVNEKVKEMDERYRVSEKTKSAFAVAEQKASTAGTAIMSNPYVSTGASWVSSAFNKVAKAAEGVSLMTKVKVEKAEEKKENQEQEKGGGATVKDLARIHLDESSVENVQPASVNSTDGGKIV
ncbi:hypothetical protein M9H77_09049 [Catharanthus roseus]|uniref:Uncharacterized protein n=1 Tax=Catharanthus roseus TaxID=4058 RepID=A0ACC0BZQ6_CATRO|nr:hypothetical protein M9H77_09049 [Catharanthus roseus]